MAVNQKLQAIRLAMETIEKQYGRGSIMRLGDQPSSKMAMEVIPTGSITLDMAIGVGGVPRGRIIEIFGPDHHLVNYCRNSKDGRSGRVY